MKDLIWCSRLTTKSSARSIAYVTSPTFLSSSCALSLTSRAEYTVVETLRSANIWLSMTAGLSCQRASRIRETVGRHMGRVVSVC